MRRAGTQVCISIAVGLAAVAVGGWLMFKPLSSLHVLILLVAGSLMVAGVGEAIPRRSPAEPWSARLLGPILILTGITVVLLPERAIGLLTSVTGGGLLLGGALRVLGGRRNRADRFVSIVGGLTCTVLGSLALSWRDLTALVIALLVGPAAVVLGIGQILRAISPDGSPASTAMPEHSRLRRHLRPVLAVASLAVASGLAGISYLLQRGTPVVTSFYRTPPELPSAPGKLLRADDLGGIAPVGTRARRILYTTTRLDGATAAASAVVVWSGKGSDSFRPVLAWAHGTTGVAEHCAPSLFWGPELRGVPRRPGFEYSMPPALERITERGWVIVATDYLGLGTEGPHPYLIGVAEAHSVLDSVRAARQLDGIALGEQTVVWGHSQGGHAALWAGIEAASYAPDVPLSGIVALAPASDLLALGSRLRDDPVSAIFKSFIIISYSKLYRDVSFDDYVRPGARLIVRETAERCVISPEILAALGLRLSRESVFGRQLTGGALAARLVENSPTRVTGIPTVVAQGLTDGLVVPEAQRAFVKRLCDAGQVVDYRVYTGRDHMGVVSEESLALPEILKWTEARFANEPVDRSCSFTQR